MTTIQTSKNKISKELGFFLMEQRIKRNQTIKEMANALKIKSHQLVKMESGEYNFSIDDIHFLCNTFDVEIYFIPKQSSKSKSPK